MVRNILITTLVILVTQSKPSVAEYETTRIFSKGVWSVEVVHNPDNDSLWCDASTSNRSRQSFGITAYDHGAMAVFIFDDRWELSERNVKFLIDIDYSRWNIDGSTAGTSGISINLEEPDKAAKFLGELVNGSAVSILNEDERRLATFSLSGSGAAIRALVDCWDKIELSKDPFKSTSDPF